MKKKLQNLLTIIFISGGILGAQNSPHQRHQLKSHHPNNESRDFQSTVYRPAAKIEYGNYDSSGGTWDLNDSVFMTYNSMANEIVNKTHDASGNLTKYDTTEYNNAGKIAKKSSFNWNGSSWDTSSVEIYTYNGQNQLITDLTKSYSSNTLSSAYMDSMIYNGNNQVTEDISSEWNGGTWDFSSKSDYFYNGNGQLIKLLGYEWNGAWEVSDSVTSITWFQWNGDLDNSLFESAIFYYSGDSPSKDSAFYDVHNNEIKYIEYSYDSMTFLWNVSYLSTNSYIYDNNNNISQDINLAYYQGSFVYSLKTVYLNYTPYSVTGVNENLKKENILVYPNPNNGVFKIRGELSGDSKIVVYNALGAKVYQTNALALNGANEIILPELTKGLYIVAIEDLNKISTIKMIVK